MSKIAILDDALHKAHSSWDFTDHRVFEEIDQRRLSDWKRWCDSQGCKFLEMAHEVGEGGKHHGQGRIIFRRNYRLSQLKKLWPDVHWEPTVVAQDCLYLRKPGMETVIHWDDRQQGRRTTFGAQKELIEGGGTVRQCINLEGANHQSARSAEILMKYLESERPCCPRQVCRVGHAADPSIPAGVYRLSNWRVWDGYDAHAAIYVDQRLCKLTLHQLRRVIGSAPFLVGYGRQARWDVVYLSGLDEDEREVVRKAQVAKPTSLAEITARMF